ncbi:hypothetical protein SAMN03159298_01663 [Pseudomonas sp. NFACC07-1]|nr:hypothetical protein SAMN03159298_01663 [Pseudomonas sp. NFACC07-1]
MVEHPGMWAGILSLFRVGTVAGLMRILPMVWPEPAGCGVGTGFGRGWVSGWSIGRRLTNQQVSLRTFVTLAQNSVAREQAPSPQGLPCARSRQEFQEAAGIKLLCHASTWLTRLSTVSMISSR